MRLLCSLLLLVSLPAAAQVYDVVLQNGRVMDPETGFDGTRSVGVNGGTIAAVSQDSLEGRTVVDASGLVIAPGFIDLHAHGQTNEANKYQARDGVTTALELESGRPFVASWLRSREGDAILNYGASVSHGGLRIAAMPKYAPAFERILAQAEGRPAPGEEQDAGPSRYETVEPDNMKALEDRLRAGFQEGALGVGMAHGYFPGASREEIFRVFQLAAAERVPVFTHVRDMGVEPMQEVLSNAAATGASLHIVHVNSMSLWNIRLVLEMIGGAQERGLDVTTEAYPYTAASTNIASAIFDPGWRDRLRMSYEDIQVQDTGERLNANTFDEYRSKGAVVIMHMMKPEWIEVAMGTPFVMVASDGMPYAPGAHPRSAGTFSRVLGRYSREQRLLPLMEALGKMTIMPAKRLEKVSAQMLRKGRLQVGADADITVFDPATIRDTATFEDDLSFSQGVQHVLVNGVFVVRDGENVDGARPGVAVVRTN